MRKVFVYALIAAALFAAMFWFSNQSGEVSLSLSDRVTYLLAPLVDPSFGGMNAAAQRAVLDSLTYPIRKCAHMAEFALLGMVVLAAVRGALTRSAKPVSKVAATAITSCIVLACAAADETHQLFVDGRSAELADVCIDLLGAALGMAAEWAVVAMRGSKSDRGSL